MSFDLHFKQHVCDTVTKIYNMYAKYEKFMIEDTKTIASCKKRQHSSVESIANALKVKITTDPAGTATYIQLLQTIFQ